MHQDIALSLAVSIQQVLTVVELLEDGATIPFIARYRKEVTGSLNEVKIESIKHLYNQSLEIKKRRSYVLKKIEEQHQLSASLKSSLLSAKTLQEVEDLYLPFKQARKTRAKSAIDGGLEPLAKALYTQNERKISEIINKSLNSKVTTNPDALSGARDIIAEWINEDIRCRDKIRNLFRNQANLESKVKKSKIKEAIKYKDYYDFTQKLSKVPSHRFLAIKRAQEAGHLNVKITVNQTQAIKLIEQIVIKQNGSYQSVQEVKTAINDAYKRLLLPSIEKEFDHQAKEKADKEAIAIFRLNLKQLLLSPPLGQKRILAVDPGLRTGCKTVVLNEFGDLLYDTVIYPLKNEEKSLTILKTLLHKHSIEGIAMGNGTGGRETAQLIKGFLKTESTLHHIPLHMVSEQGASVYSASETAREEFPAQDITVRGAVSIGRRLKDPLAELVKIDPRSIGVGQYQHEVNKKALKESLDQVVMSCVNQVGVELNTASKHLLSYVAGLGPALAQNVVDYRSKNGAFKSRNQLKKVPRLGEKAFEQAAGFLRINEAKNPLDNLAVHPESYHVVKQMAQDLQMTIPQLISTKNKLQLLDPSKYVNQKIGLLTVKDIIKELEKPTRDPRSKLEEFEFSHVHHIKDLSPGMVLNGVITNITAFGCFVDVGVHQDGLVHVSQMANKFVKDPNEVVSLNEKVQVKITDIDLIRKRIGLTMKIN